MVIATAPCEPGCFLNINLCLHWTVWTFIEPKVLSQNIKVLKGRLCPPLTLLSGPGCNIYSQPCFINPSASPKN